MSLHFFINTIVQIHEGYKFMFLSVFIGNRQLSRELKIIATGKLAIYLSIKIYYSKVLI